MIPMLNIRLENASEKELTALKEGSLINRRMIAGMNGRHNAAVYLLRELRELRDTAESDDAAKVFEFDIVNMEQRIAAFVFTEHVLTKLGFAVHEERPRIHTLAGTRRLIAQVRQKRGRK